MTMKFQCPDCQSTEFEITDHNTEDGTIECKCRECGWTTSGRIFNPTDEKIVGEVRGRISLTSIPKEVGMGTKRIAPTGHGHHVYIDRQMMIASGVDTGDIVHILIWKSIRGG